MSRDEIFFKISTILNDSFDKHDVKLSSYLSKGEDSLDMDSMELVSFIVEAENAFDVIIDFDVLFVTVEDVVCEVDRLINLQENEK